MTNVTGLLRQMTSTTLNERTKKMKLILKNVQIIYPPNLFRATLPPQASADSLPRYSCAFLIDKNTDAYKELMAVVDAECKEKLGEKWQVKAKAFKSNPQKYCVSDYVDSEGNETDFVMLKAYRKEADGRPIAVKRDRTQVDESEAVFYSGCFVNASVTIYVMSDTTKGGIRCGLTGVQFVKDGERHGASAPNINDFEEIEPDDSDDGLE